MNDNVGFIGERIVQRIVRDLADSGLSLDACRDIGRNLERSIRNRIETALEGLGEDVGTELRKAVQRICQFEPQTEKVMAQYSSVPNVLAEQLLSESNNGNVMAGPAVGGWLSSITDLIAKLQSTGLDLNAIIALVTKAIPLIKSGDWLGVIALILEQFATKAAPSGPTIAGG